MKWQEKIYSYPLPTRYVLSSDQGEGLVILLHGYQDNAPSMLRKLGWQDKTLPFQWLAPNAPFPVPVWNADGFKEAYSWYFRDTDRKLIYVKPATTAERLAQLLSEIGLLQRPIVIFGFSQGGYLAPFLAKHLPNAKAIIGVGCGYTDEGFDGLKPLPVWGIHGVNDERIPIEKGRSEHAAVLTKGFPGEFIEVPGLTHKVDLSIEPKVRELIARAWKE